MKLFLTPSPEMAGTGNGIGQVVQAQYRHLPDFGIEIVRRAEDADMVACHIHGVGLDEVDVLHCHGWHWTGDPGSGVYDNTHHQINQAIAMTARRARAVTVPSEWVATPFRRDMHLNPEVIGHGLDLDEWEPLPVAERGNFLLWNKNRAGDVCTPKAAIELARRGLPVVSTFGESQIMQVTGPLPFPQMKELVRQAGVYLATAKETFGIGILEALACGVPVLGYRHGGIVDLVQHKETGYLVEPGDTSGLEKGYKWLLERREKLTQVCRNAAENYRWPRIIERYARLYREIYERKQKTPKVAVVLTNHNYSGYVGEAVQSCLSQSKRPDQIVVVDDKSSDNSLEVLKNYPEIEVIANETNLGVAESRNRGIRATDCEYVVCLDADDFLAPGYVETLYNAMVADTGIGVGYTGITMHFPNGDVGVSAWPPEFDFDTMTHVSTPPQNCVPCAAMFKREMWERAGGYRQEHAPAEDTEFFLRGLSLGFEGKRVTREPLFHYRLHEGSASRTKQYKPIDRWHPWMRDGQLPMAAPSKRQPLVRSYSQPLVSVVIPVGPGHGKYLPRALDSLVGQTFREWEAVVVDDAPEGVDLTAYPFARLYETHPYYDTNNSFGAGVARNVGLEQARAPLLLWLDADDWLEPDALEKMVLAYSKSGGHYIYTDWYAVNEAGQREMLNCQEYDARAMLDKLQHAVTVLMATDDARRVGGFDPDLKSWEDWDFFAKCAAAGIHGRRLPEPLLNYRVHTGTRRQLAFKESDGLFKTISERYKDYRDGGKEIMGCCGGNSKAAVAAALGAVNSEQFLAQASQPELAGKVQMVFTGQQIGAMSWTARQGVIYTGANNDQERYQWVDEQDVDFMLRTGSWALAS